MVTKRLFRTALLAACLSVATSAHASDHLDPPAVAEDPAVDIADVYAFVGGVTMIGEMPVPNAVIVLTIVGPPELDVLYALELDTDPSNDETDGLTRDAQGRFWFEPNPGTDDGTPWCLNFELNALVVDSCLVGGSFDSGTYDFSVDLTPLIGAGEVQLFAGLRDDPFFFDLDAFNAFVGELLNFSETYCDEAGLCDCGEGGVEPFCYLDLNDYDGNWQPTTIADAIPARSPTNTFAGGDVYAFVVEAPSVALAATHISAYAATYRRAARVRTTRGDIERGPWVQLDRLAVPALSTGLFLDSNDKLLFNRDDVNNSYGVQLGGTIDLIRLLASRALVAFNHTTANGFAEDRDPPTVAPPTADLVALIDPDVVRLDLTAEAVPLFPTFPNGRTLDFDVMDAILTLVLGIPVTDEVDPDDPDVCPPLSEFPYVDEPGCPGE